MANIKCILFTFSLIINKYCTFEKLETRSLGLKDQSQGLPSPHSPVPPHENVFPAKPKYFGWTA